MRTPFRALLWKESRESANHAGAIVLLFAMLIQAWVPGLRGLATGPNPPWRVGYYHVIAAVVALGFGLAQTNRETREMWSFALHRPVSGVQVFVAKLLTGSVALLLAIGIPYVACLWWLSIPGVRPVPFDPAYWLPAIVSLAATLTWYVAGLYAGARQRGFTGRMIGVPVALLASDIAGRAPSFGVALASIIALTAVLAVAACSEFLSGSDFESQRRMGRSAVVTTAIYAVAAVFAVAATNSRLLPDEHSPDDPPPPTEGVALTRDGSVVRVTASDTPDRSGVYLSKALATDEGAIASMDNLPYNNPGRWVARLFPGARGFAMYYERRTGLISVYDDSTGAFRGWLGPDGFSTSREKPAKRFSGYLQTEPLGGTMPFGALILSGGYYDLNATVEAPKLVFAPPAGEHLIAIARAVEPGTGSPATPEPWGDFLVATTDKRIYAVDEKGAIRFSSAYTEGERGRPVRIIRFGEPASRRTLLWYGPRDAGDTLNHVVEVAEDGAAVRSFTVAGVFVPGAPEPCCDGSAWTRPASLAPLRVMPAVEAVYAAFYMEGSARRVRIAVLLCLVSAAFTWLMCRRYGLERGRSAAWTALGAVTGPIAPVVMVLLLERPSREALAARRGARTQPAWSAT